MKKTPTIFIASIIILLFGACSKNTAITQEEIESPTVPMYSTQIELNCVENLLFSRYDVDVYIDGNKIGKLDHGATRTYSIELSEGIHILTVTKEGNKSIDGEVDFTVSEDMQDMQFSYKINCTSNNVKIEEIITDDVSLNDVADYESSIETINKVAYVRENSEYSMYFLFDMDNKVVRYFTTSGYGVLVGTFEGDLNSGLTIYYDYDEGFSETFKYKYTDDDSTAILIDYNQFDYEYKKTDVATAENILNQPEYYDMNPLTPSQTSITDSEDNSEDDTNVEESAAIESITIDNNSDFAAILTAEYVDPEKQATFVSMYKGKIVEFDCIVLYLEQNAKYKTIYSYILVPGEDKDNLGATLFYLEDMSMFAFKWDSATRPEYLTVGSKIRIQAEVVSGDDPSYIYLKPVYTWGR